MSLFILVALGVALLFIPFATSVSVPISFPISAPAVAPSISPSLFSFSIEQDRWTEWAGPVSTNAFAFNVFDNLKQLTGQPPWIRIGADSEDHTNFNSAVQFSEAIFPASTPTVPYPEASNITVGNGFYQAVAKLPSDTHVIWGVNLGESNITAAFLETKSIIRAFQSEAVRKRGISLDFIEIGNEADLYAKHHVRNPATWDVELYIEEWTKFAVNLSEAADLSASSGTKFLGGSLAFSTATPTGFSPQALILGGILDSVPGSLVTTMSQHHYSGSFCSGQAGLLAELMNKGTIRSNLTYFLPDIAATHASDLDYIFGETNSYSCHGAPGVSNTAGAALWALDYGLFASQIGISRLHFHEGIGYKYNLIQPVTLFNSILDGSPLPQPAEPHVQPAYYAAIIAAEAIGSSGATKAIEISVDDSTISGYAFFEKDRLVRAVLINSAAFLSGQRTRASTHLTITFTGSGAAPTTITIKRLAIGHADDTSGLTWGGQTYETPNGRVEGTLAVTKANIKDGIDIRATEAVLLTFS